MVFSDGLTKANRLIEVVFLFHRNPGRALTSSEIAHRLGINQRTARNYLLDLSSTGRLPIVRHGRGWRLVEGARLQVPPVRFLLEEAAALFLAARLLLAEADEPNRAVADALARLAAVMPEEVRPAFAAVAARASRDGGAMGVIFRTFAYAWALRRVLRVEYAARTRGGATTCVEFEPYLLETVPASRAVYAIGRSTPPGELRVLKLERVRSVEPTGASFTPPDLQPILDRLSTAWGVWLGNDRPVDVALRFAPEVAARVRETRWHPSQRLTINPDGTVDLHLTVASTVELLPWILGWGRHCRVLAPPDLADQVAREHREAGEGYHEDRRTPSEQPPEVDDAS
ncbi:MAG TPA: WYL domain-containing protein [Thermoanaerobaculaceae bacterium]|nr:WYL domain-containing protein [Thermoanaerobaculaceae bacterium]HRS15481.1 WYL domain-containing protein [Thermoanaerobaculaceae bacterium]